MLISVRLNITFEGGICLVFVEIFMLKDLTVGAPLGGCLSYL
jgi:hypothetical protein